jgi:acyl-CoA thioester hydrolase
MNPPRRPAATKRRSVSAAPAQQKAIAAAPIRPLTMARVPLSVRWGDLDAFNHVNNAAFLVYAQEARLAWLAGIDGVWFDETMMPVVAAAEVNYRRQLAWPAEILIELTATRIGNSSLTIAHRIVAADDGDGVYADGEVVMVWVDPASGRSVPLPAAIRTACQPPAESGASTSK